jgi:hypothetical protein
LNFEDTGHLSISPFAGSSASGTRAQCGCFAVLPQVLEF